MSIGEKLSRYLTILIWALQMIFIVYFVYTGVFKLPVLIVLFTVPKLIKTAIIFLKPKPSRPDPVRKTTLPLYFASFAFVYNRIFSMLFLAGLIMDLFLK